MRCPLVSACVFFLLCCLHLCSAHNFSASNKSQPWTENKTEFIVKVFQKYGNGETMSLQGFEKLLRDIKLDNLIPPHNHVVSSVKESNSSNSTHHENVSDNFCLSSSRLLYGEQELTMAMYREVCPILVSQLLPITFQTKICHLQPVETDEETVQNDILAVWMYSSLSILVISLCGLLGVAVIPFMHQVFYHQLIQFLVALAVGTLCGDALLHLLPHAMSGSHSHSHAKNHSHSHELPPSDHNTNIWRGLVAMLGVVFFYFTEKCLTLVAELRKKRQRRTQLMPRVRVMRDADSQTSGAKVGEKLYNHQNVVSSNVSEENAVCKGITQTSNKEEAENKIIENNCNISNGPDLTKENELNVSTQKSIADPNDGIVTDDRYTVIIREHEHPHHGHSHTHGHVHSAPQSMSSVAWMVIMGDGLHNFTDGMAIGAAFSINIAGGFSTALAVFCHELPHELGDFAVLLKAGMSAKQAVFYNMLSSILCFIGMCVGIFLGHDELMSQSMFAAAAGMFLYIALVDMVPELTSSHSKEGGSLCQCILQFVGLMAGIVIMLLIAIYEDDLKTVFDN